MKSAKGWIEGIEPSYSVPQTDVLPLNYTHHSEDFFYLLCPHQDSNLGPFA